jgi:hypothetical protein
MSGGLSAKVVVIERMATVFALIDDPELSKCPIFMGLNPYPDVHPPLIIGPFKTLQS